MKRGSYLERRTPLKSGSRLKSTKGFRKRNAPLRKESKEPAAKLKKRIQGLLREIVILRDGGCVLRHYPEAGACGWLRADGELILQAEHLNGRSASATYGDLRNIICICIQHHFFFKKQKPALYWDLVRTHIGEERWRFVQEAIRDKAAHKMVWQYVIAALEKERDALLSGTIAAITR